MRKMQYGIEIEFFGMRTEQVVDTLRGAGIHVANRRSQSDHINDGDWILKSDGSVNAEGHEIISPILHQKDLPKVKQVLDLLKAHGGRVDGSCGIHIHHDATGLGTNNVKTLLFYYTRHKKVFDAIMTADRLSHNNYCNYYTESELERAFNSSTIGHMAGTRYKVVNVQAYAAHNTIEFRQHYGCLNSDNILNWIMLTHKLMEYAAEHPMNNYDSHINTADLKTSILNLIKDLKLNGTELNRFLIRRVIERHLNLAA